MPIDLHGRIIIQTACNDVGSAPQFDSEPLAACSSHDAPVIKSAMALPLVQAVEALWIRLHDNRMQKVRRWFLFPSRRTDMRGVSMRTQYQHHAYQRKPCSHGIAVFMRRRANKS